MEKTKRPEVTHNTTKVKVLLYLSMKRKAGNRPATAREIAQVTGGNARSLYVLLERWERWQLVFRNYETTPYTYMIAPEGERYLSKIGDWFFSGYYSKKRKRRVLGFRGKVEDLNHEIATAAKATVYAYDTKRNELFYFEAPFRKAENFHREPIVDGERRRWGKDRLILVKCEGVSAAYNTLLEWNCFSKMKPMGQAMVNADIGVVWGSDEEKN